MLSATQQLIAILERSSKTYIKKHIDKYVERIDSVVKQWRKWVRQQLSVPYIKGTRNTSLYPRLRSGALRSALVARRIQVKSISTMSNGRAQAKIVIPITYSKLKNNYDEILNKSSGTYGGWKDRVQAELEKRIQGRL